MGARKYHRGCSHVTIDLCQWNFGRNGQGGGGREESEIKLQILVANLVI